MENLRRTGGGVMKFPIRIVNLLFLLFLLGCSKNEPSLPALVLDRKASSFIKEKKSEKALPLYYQILETDSDLSSVHSNLGILFSLDKKNEEALKSLEFALRLALQQQDLEKQFAIRFNLGTLFGAQKKILEALENYQAALEIKPDSKETKHNIELLIQNSAGGESSGDEKKDQKGDGSGQDQEQKDDPKKGDQDKEQGQDKEKDKDKNGDEGPEKKKKPEYEKNSKYKPRPFNGDDLSEGDVKKILGELKDQEQKIRANFEKKERKDKNNDKDW